MQQYKRVEMTATDSIWDSELKGKNPILHL